MLSLPTKVRVFFCTQATDMRRSFDGLHGLIANVMKQDPLSGDLFMFLNRRQDRVKIMVWEGDGLTIWYKRLESGTFATPEGEGNSVALTPAQLALVLAGVDLKSTHQRKRYRRSA